MFHKLLITVTKMQKGIAIHSAITVMTQPYISQTWCWPTWVKTYSPFIKNIIIFVIRIVVLDCIIYI